MVEILQELWKSKSRVFAALLTTFFVIFVPFYPEVFRSFPLWLQIVAVLIVVVANIAVSNIPDIISLAMKNRRLQAQIGTLRREYRSIASEREQELGDLKDLIVSFVEHSHTYQDRILRLLKIHGEYLCIAKSSEGLSEVFNALDPRPHLPFSKVLTQWPGAIKPFENMNLFLLPTASLQGFSDDQIKPWINKNIIPLVEAERVRFLASIPRKIARKADEFSYKYLAFMVRSDSIEFDTRNRKFTKSLIDTLVGGQSKKSVAHMTQELTEIIRTKDLFNIVDWSAFVDLNSDQQALFGKHKARLLELLAAHNLHTLVDISRCNLDILKRLYIDAFGRGFTERRAVNLAQKTLVGVKRVFDTLRKHGIEL